MTSGAPTAHKEYRSVLNIHFARLVALLGFGFLAIFLAQAPLIWSAAALGIAGLALAILLRPAVGLVALAFFIPLGELQPLSIRSVNAIDLLVVLVVIGWLAQGIARREIVFRHAPLLWPLALFVGAGTLSLLQARSWGEGVPELLKWIEFALLYLAATQILDRRYIWLLVGALLSAGVLQVALGVTQFFGQTGPEAFILAGRFMRAYGTFRQPNPYAGYLGYLAPVATSLTLAGLWVWWRSRRRSSLLIGLTCGATAIALIAGIGLSWSRGSWIALAAALVAVVALRSRRATLVMVVAGCGLVVIISVAGMAWLPTVISGRVSGLGSYVIGPDPARTEISDDNFAVLERLAHWQAGLRMYDDNPWIGVGIGNYGPAYANYALPHWYEPLGHAHNIYINFLAETGILGTLAFLALWLGALRLTWKTATATRDYPAALAIGVFGTLVYLSVHNLFDNLFVQHMQLQLALLLGCVVTVGRTNA